MDIDRYRIIHHLFYNDLKFHWNVTALNVVACLMPPYPYIVHFNVWRALTQRKGRDKKENNDPLIV